MDGSIFDPSERSLEKQNARDRDEQDIASGVRTAAQVNAENGSAFAFPRVRLHLRGLRSPR